MDTNMYIRQLEERVRLLEEKLNNITLRQNDKVYFVHCQIENIETLSESPIIVQSSHIIAGEDCNIRAEHCTIINCDIEDAEDRIDEIESKLDDAEDRVDDIESSLDELEDKISELSEQTKNHDD